MLCYLTFVFGLIGILVSGAYRQAELIPLALGVAGFGVANEKRWGYYLGVVLATLNLLTDLYILFLGFYGIALTLLFAGVLVALFLHPQSRQYQKIWFR